MSDNCIIKKNIVLNKKYGGFHLSDIALKYFCNKKYGMNIEKVIINKNEIIKVQDFNSFNFDLYMLNSNDIDGKKINNFRDRIFIIDNIDRTDEILIETVKKFGEDANTPVSKLVIEELIIHVNINDFDGMETVDSDCFKIY